MRIRRILAIASYEAADKLQGKQGLRFVALAAALLLPAGLAPPVLPLLQPPVEEAPVAVAPIRVAGPVPEELRGRFVEADRGTIQIVDARPLVVRARFLTRDVIHALEEAVGPSLVRLRAYFAAVDLPERSILIAMLAVSLLTGPLAEALPGERARRTLEVLLSAGISRTELVTGKWLTWTAAATASAVVSSVSAMARGVQEPGWWLLGLPSFAASSVAVGMWLVRRVDDVVGGATAPMRVLPLLASAMALAGYAIRSDSPWLAASLPVGGPLLVAGGLLDTPAAALVSTAATVAFVWFVLAATARELAMLDAVRRMTRYGALGMAVVSTLLWWLSVPGPGIFANAGRPEMESAPAASLIAGAAVLLACSLVAIARSGVAPSLRIDATGIGCAVAVGLVLGLAPGIDAASISTAPIFAAMVPRSLASALPDPREFGFALAATAVAAQALLYRQVLAGGVGWIGASAAWALAALPFAPWRIVIGSLAVGAVGARFGVVAAAIAHVLWAFAPSGLRLSGGSGIEIATQVAALAIAVAAANAGLGAPRRHQV